MIIELQPNEAKWIKIYESHTPPFDGARPRYYILVPCEHLPDDLDVRRNLDGTVPLTSIYRVEVKPVWAIYKMGNPVDQLVQELQRLDARNVSRDQVFKDRRIDVECRVSDGRLILQSVTVYL